MLFGLPLLHIAIGANPATGRKRSAKGIIALGSAPRGVIAFGDVAVGVVACGIISFGVGSASVVAVGVVALGSASVGLLLAVGGVAMAPVAMGGAAFGYYASGTIAAGMHAIGSGSSDPLAGKFFNTWADKFMRQVFFGSFICMPVFLALGLVPSLMAKISERRRQRCFQPDKSKPV
jgi:hypothetical protein